MLLIVVALISSALSTQAQWAHTASGPWASFNFGQWTVYQNEWGQPETYCELYANSASNWASAGSWTGPGTKGYPHVQGNPNIAIGSHWVSSSFNFSGPNSGVYTLVFDCWTAGHQDELMIEESKVGTTGSWGTQIASNQTIGGRLYSSVWQAHNGANNVLIFTPASYRTSGTTDLMAPFVWARDRGLLHNNTLYEISFGPEITSTNGWQQFTMNSFSASWGTSGGCTPTAITPYVQVNGGSWQQTGSVTVNAGATVRFGPQPVSGGSWSWSGCGVSGSSREQTFTANSSCTATATYTNSSGCQSTQNFNVTVSGSGGGGGSGYVRIQNRATGLYIDGMGRTSNGSNAGQWSSSGINQHWTMETSGSYVKFRNRATGLYLDGMGRTSNGSLVSQWSSSTSNNQQWTVEDIGGYKRIRNRATNLYIDGMYWSSNGSDLGQWSNSGSDGQQWSITTVTSSAREATTPLEVTAEEQSADRILLYPNPFKSSFTIQLENPDEVRRIGIIDMMGREVLDVKPDAISQSTSFGAELSPGFYLVKINGARWSKSIKVFKE